MTSNYLPISVSALLFFFLYKPYGNKYESALSTKWKIIRGRRLGLLILTIKRVIRCEQCLQLYIYGAYTNMARYLPIYLIVSYKKLNRPDKIKINSMTFMVWSNGFFNLKNV